MKDYYAILEVPPTASQEAIREQYLLLIQAWHPDKFPNPAQRAKAEEKCKEINIAYDVLKDAQKRLKYDRDIREQPAGTRSGRDERRREADERRPRRPAETARPRPPEAPVQDREQPEPERRETDAERRAREEEWIRIYFEAARRRASSQSGTSAAAKTPIRVCIAEDVPSTRVGLRGLLSADENIRVVGEAANGVQAVKQFDALMPDVMIAGIDTPDPDSLGATEAILRKHPTARIVILSVPSSHTFIRRAAMTGACDYLLKPASRDELELAIRLAAGH